MVSVSSEPLGILVHQQRRPYGKQMLEDSGGVVHTPEPRKYEEDYV